MNEPLEETYFKWLCDKVLNVRNSTPSLRFDRLFRILHETEFSWTILGDDNRAADGVELRSEFLSQTRMIASRDWLFIGCSLFEMFIAFSERAEFVTEMSRQHWFWHILQNLGLDQFNDANIIADEYIYDVLHRLIWRQYDYDGRGGLFPLQNPTQDQTKVEIWYQFFAYLDEQGL